MNRCGRFRRHFDAFFIVHSFRNAAMAVEKRKLVRFGVREAVSDRREEVSRQRPVHCNQQLIESFVLQSRDRHHIEVLPCCELAGPNPLGLLESDAVALVQHQDLRLVPGIQFLQHLVDFLDVCAALGARYVDHVEAHHRLCHFFQGCAKSAYQAGGNREMKPTVSETSTRRWDGSSKARIVGSSVANMRASARTLPEVSALNNVDLPALV